MQNKKIISLIMLASFAAAGTVGCAPLGAAQVNTVNVPSATDAALVQEIPADLTSNSSNDEINVEIPEIENMPQIMSLTGTITDIQERKDESTGAVSTVVKITHDENAEAEFIINDQTYAVTEAELAIGSPFTGWFDATLPMTLQYPPRYTALAVLGEELLGEENLKIDRFNDQLVSSDNMLALNLSEDTTITNPAGETLTAEDLADELLVVVYGVSTRSIPAQTTPHSIVVLQKEEATDADGAATDSDDSSEGIDGAEENLEVNSQVLDGDTDA